MLQHVGHGHRDQRVVVSIDTHMVPDIKATRGLRGVFDLMVDSSYEDDSFGAAVDTVRCPIAVGSGRIHADKTSTFNLVTHNNLQL